MYSVNADEAAYYQTLDKVREFQNRVLDKHFDGFATTRRGDILRKVKTAMRYGDKQLLRRYLREYAQAGGSNKGVNYPPPNARWRLRWELPNSSRTALNLNG